MNLYGLTQCTQLQSNFKAGGLTAESVKRNGGNSTILPMPFSVAYDVYE